MILYSVHFVQLSLPLFLIKFANKHLNLQEPAVIPSMASSSTSSVHKSFKYDVFLSFRGEDTRKSFIDHLYYALQQKNISTYKDDERIEKGKRISDELMESIEDSKFFIIVFSKKYASSSWCLNELLKIMECHKSTEHTVYPVFYDVEPSEIRNQTGAVGEAFARHEKEEAAGKWRKALKEAADVAGWELKNTADGHEAKFIRQIVEKLSLELRAINVSIDKNLVGMEIRIKDIISSLGTASDGVHMIGIWGIGGGGKTTLAKAIFDKISFQFEGKSFVENVREVSNAPLSGLKPLQIQILSNVLNNHGINIGSVSEGKNMMSWMMGGRKTLLVLDDVDHVAQLEALAGDPSWFKSGSIIIITTRDEQVLVAHGVKLIHNVNLLSDKEAIWLFSRYAFGRDFPYQEYQEPCGKVVCYAAGLPLTIKVLGSFLCGKSKLEWEDALNRLKTIPLQETQKKLELSYIGLDDDYKEIFLDVATILKGWRKDFIIQALESCGFHARIGLRVLEQKSLITIDGERLGMHDHLEEMGRNIVRRSHPDMPNKHSRLWNRKQIEDILANDLGTEATRCVQFYQGRLSPQIVMEGLRKMKELRFLDVENLFSSLEDNKTMPNFLNGLGFLCCNWGFDKVSLSPYFPDGLRFLRWTSYPFRSLPQTFEGSNLVALDMTNSDMLQLWEGGERKVLKQLRFLDLRGCSRLRSIDLGQTPNLEILTITRYGGLVELYMPFERLKLRSLELHGVKLKRFDLGLTPNLEKLWLEGEGSELEELHMPGKCLNLKSLHLTHSKLTTIDIGLTPNLEDLYIGYCNDLEELEKANKCVKLRSLKLSGLKLRTFDLGPSPNLERLSFYDCNDLEEFHITECPILTSIKIGLSKLRILDLRLVPNLNKLFLFECKGLVDLHMPSRCLNLKSLKITNSKLRTLDIGLAPILTHLSFTSCYYLEELHLANECQELESITITHSKLRTLDLGMAPNLKELHLKECYKLVQLHPLIRCLKNLVDLELSGSFWFMYFSFHIKDNTSGRVNESLEVRPLANLYFTLGSCPFHLDYHLPEFEFTCFHKEDLPSLTTSIEKLICGDPCTCIRLETFSSSICELQR
ncbi:disease resistance protein RPV1 isoform X1 [Lactuca sativa]|nr:disease resistance protein RPV1 isoform X1 [Lactuca sativa]